MNRSKMSFENELSSLPSDPQLTVSSQYHPDFHTRSSLSKRYHKRSKSLSCLEVFPPESCEEPRLDRLFNSCLLPLDSDCDQSKDKRSIRCGHYFKADLAELISVQPAAVKTGSSSSLRKRLESKSVESANEPLACSHSITSTCHHCHCRACCSCSPVDHLRGLCPGSVPGAVQGYYELSTSTDSALDRVSSLKSKCLLQARCRNSEGGTGLQQLNREIDSSLMILPARDVHSTCTLEADNGLVTSNENVANESDDQEVFYPIVSSSLATNNVSALEFRQQLEQMRTWFCDFNDEQRNVLLTELTRQCRLPQMHLLSVIMSSQMHSGCPPNCEDHLGRMPDIIAFKILSLLDPVSLCNASLVCHRWHELANEPLLWRWLCRLDKWGLSHSAELKQYIRFSSSDGRDWKGMFAERFRLQNNWLKGRCHVRTFEGHTQGVSCVQFDETRIVSGSSDKTIKLWNIRTNRPWAAQTLVGHSGTVRCLHLEGNRLVSGSTDCMIKVWDLSAEASWSSVACKVTMVGHMETVRCLQVDDDKVISGSYDTTLKIWDLKTGHCRRTLRGHDAAVLCVQFDGEKIISGSCDKSIKVWSYDGSCVVTLQGHQDAVTCLQFDNTRIITGSLDRTLRFWDIRNWRCINVIDWKASEGHTGVIRYLQADKWRVVSASDDRTIKVWNLETGKRLATLRNHTDGVTCLQFNDRIIVSGSYDKTVKLWDFGCC